MKLIKIEAQVRVIVGNRAATEFEKIEYVYKPTLSQQKTNFAALKDMAILVFKENTKGKFQLRIAENDGATYPVDWNTRTKGIRELVEEADSACTLMFRDGRTVPWSLEYKDLVATEVDTEEIQP